MAKGILRTMSKRDGDAIAEWDTENPATWDQARLRCETALKRGGAIFEVKGFGRPDVIMGAFDPSVREILLVGQYQGG